ncbi:tape measure protein [Sporosarcina contaminans]|uniref:Tape measure protein n=1 Tax=Sporosarcina contaminans TaxID=633403 RepID=A0ABW3U315_9BACL
MDSLREMFVSIAFQDNASKAVREVNKSMDAVKNAFKNSSSEAVQTSSAVKEVGKTMKSAASEIKRTDTGFKTATSAVKKAKTAFKQTDTGTRKMTGTFRMASSALKTTADAAKPIPKELSLIRKAMNTVGSASKSATSAVGRFATSGLNQIKNAAGSGLDKLVGGFRSLPGIAGGAAMKVGSSVTNFITAPLRGAVGMVQQYAGALGLLSGGALAASGMGRLSAIENAQTSLTVMMGDAGRATKFMDDVLAFAKTTPFAFPDLAETSRNLIAFGMDEAKVVPTLKAIGDAAAATGKGSEGLNQVASAFGDMQIAGQLGMDQINRLQSAGVPALKIMANTFGISTDEMKKKISSGAVDSVKAIDQLVKGMQEGTSGVAGETAKMAGIMEKTKENWTGSVDSLKSSISSTMATLIEPAKPHIQNAMAWFGKQFGKLPDIIFPIVDKVKPAFKAIGSVVKTASTAVYGIFQAFKGGAGTLNGIVSFQKMGLSREEADKVISVIKSIKENIKTVIDFITGKLPAIKAAFSYGFEAVTPIVNKAIEIFGTIREVISTLIQNVILPLLPMAGNIIANVFQFVQPILEMVGKAFGLIKNVVMVLVNNVIVPLMPIVSSIIETAFNIINPILRIAKSLFSVIIDVVTFLVNNVVKPLIPVIGVVIEAAWFVIEPILDGIIWAFDKIASAIEWAVEKFQLFSDVAKSFKMPKIGMPKWMGGNGVLQFDGSHATGLARVPHDNYAANLHKDEAVLTAEQSKALRSAGILQEQGDKPVLNMRGGGASGTPSGGNSGASNSNQFIFQISGNNAEDIARAVRREVENIFAGLNAVTEG